MKQIPDNVFRGYDLRGLVGLELDEERVEVLGRAYATWLLKRRIYDCVVGYDSRTSSPSFHSAMVKGLTRSGITVYDIGITLSQIAYFSQYYFRTRGMVMITASHNAKEYNGFKFATGYSETMLTSDIMAYKNLVNSGKFLKKSGEGIVIKKDIFKEYEDDLFRRIDKLDKFKIVVDSCAATTGLFLPHIFRRAGCEVIEQNTKLDGEFPVGIADPTETNVQKRLADRVILEKADLGFSYDTDGDRIGIVDNKGNFVWNDVFLSLLSQDILHYLPGRKIVFNNLCSKQVEEVILKNKGIPVMWKTGHSFIKAKIREEGAPFGGELSGHMYFVDNFYGHDDGAIASLRLLSYLTRIKKSLAGAVFDLPHYFGSPEIKLGCADNIKFKIINTKILKAVKQLYPDARYSMIDGVRMDTKEEMIVIRASQNGPYITIKFESKTKKNYEIVKKQVYKLLFECKEVDFSVGTNLEAFK